MAMIPTTTVQNQLAANPASLWESHADELADFTLARLVNRDDVYGLYKTWTDPKGGAHKVRTAPAKRDRGRVKLTGDTITRHYTKPGNGSTIGLHSTSPNGTCRWLAIDIDRHDDDDPTPASTYEAAALHWKRKAEADGLHVVLEDSNGVGGYHLWLVFTQPIPAARAFYYARWLVSDYAEHGLSESPETFPKQADIGDGYGNWIRLPGKHHTRDHLSRFYDGEQWTEGPSAWLCMAFNDDVPDREPPAEAAPESKPRLTPPTPSNAADRCIKYLEKIPDAISGQDGHGRTLQAACEAYRFGLSDGEAASVLRWFNGAKCTPAWTEGELQHKLRSAKDKVGKAGEIGIRLTEERDTDDPQVGSAWQLQAGLADTPAESDAPSKPAKSDEPKYLTGKGLIDAFNSGLAGGFSFHTYNLSPLLNPPGHHAECPLIVGQGFVTLLGGQPGAGKSAISEQVVWYILKTDPKARVFFANVELTSEVLLARHMTRLTGIETKNILTGQLAENERDKVQQHFDELAPLLDRVAIYPNPRNWTDVAGAIRHFAANVVVADYLQRFKGGEQSQSLREDVGVVMQSLRACADGGRAVLAVSALSRSKTSSGSGYAASDGIASFRESSEVEYGADFAYIIANTEHPSTKRLHCVKNRYGRLGTYGASFDGERGEWKIGANLEGGA